MAVFQTNALRVRPGRMQEFMANVATAKKIIERSGGKLHVWNVVTGTNAPARIIVVETADWKSYGEYQAKLSADSEWQKFVAKIMEGREPAVDPIGNGLSVDVPVG